MPQRNLLGVLKYSRKWQKEFNIEENDYKEFLKTEIEIIPVKYFYYLYDEHTFIKSPFNENNYHISRNRTTHILEPHNGKN